jgi:hypothetical protein
MGVRRRSQSRIDKRIRTLDGELRAPKTKHVLCRDSLAQKGTSRERVPVHGEGAAKGLRDDGDDAQLRCSSGFL